MQQLFSSTTTATPQSIKIFLGVINSDLRLIYRLTCTKIVNYLEILVHTPVYITVNFIKINKRIILFQNEYKELWNEKSFVGKVRIIFQLY